MPSLESNRGAKRAREAREALGYTREGPLPDLITVVEQEGGAHVVVLDLGDGVAGAYIAKSGCPLLFVNGRQALPRQRFTLAHEYGHHRMGHASVVDQQVVISGRTHDPNEVMANAFAAEFLMPKQAIARWGIEEVGGPVTLEHVCRLANEYGVSAQAARYALDNAGVCSDSARCAALDREIADELHVDVMAHLGLHPEPDELADAASRLPHIPRTLKDTALGDLLAGEIGPADLAARTGRETSEIDAMLAGLKLDQLLVAGASG